MVESLGYVPTTRSPKGDESVCGRTTGGPDSIPTRRTVGVKDGRGESTHGVIRSGGATPTTSGITPRYHWRTKSRTNWRSGEAPTEEGRECPWQDRGRGQYRYGAGRRRRRVRYTGSRTDTGESRTRTRTTGRDAPPTPRGRPTTKGIPLSGPHVTMGRRHREGKPINAHFKRSTGTCVEPTHMDPRLTDPVSNTCL